MVVKIHRTISLVCLLLLIFGDIPPSMQQDGSSHDGFPRAYLFRNSTNLTLPQGSYIIRVLVVGGGGPGCTENPNGQRGRSGEVTVAIVSFDIERNYTSYAVVVGHGREVVKPGGGARPPPLPDNSKSSALGYTAVGGRCSDMTGSIPQQRHFEHFFFSNISSGSPGNESNHPVSKVVLGGEGGVLVNNTGPTAQKGTQLYSSWGGVGYGAGGGSAGKLNSDGNTTHLITHPGEDGHGAPGLVYVEIIPRVCRGAVQVMFALESSVNFKNQLKSVHYLLEDSFHISNNLAKVSIMSYRNTTNTQIKFYQYEADSDGLEFAIRRVEPVKDKPDVKVNFENMLRAALKTFEDIEEPNDDTKTLVIFTNQLTVYTTNELTRLKEDFKRMKVAIIVVGLAENLREEELEKLTYKRGYVFIADSSVVNGSKVPPIVNLICRAPLFRHHAVAMTTITPPSTRPETTTQNIQREFNYLLSYDITKSDPNNSTEVKRIMGIANNVIRNSHKIPNASLIAPGLKVFQFLEDYGLNMASKLDANESKSSRHYQQGDMDMAILSVKVSTLETLDLSKALLHIDSGHVTLPREAFGDSDRGGVVFLMLNPAMSMKNTNMSMISSKVMSINVKPKARHPFSKPVDLTFTINKVKQERLQASCEFWDHSQRSSRASHGAWSSKGCKVVQENKTSVSCQCNHLTSFAVLTRILPQKDSLLGDHEKYLSIITYVGCSLSMLGCILTIVIHACLPSLRTERTFIHLNLVTAILIGQCFFFIAASIRGPKGLCFAVAIALYLFYLSVFAWMLVEGLHIYCLVIRVFHSGHERKRLYTFIGWVLPLIITIVCAASFRGDFVARNICWLSTETGAIWAFVGPALVIIAINLVILVLVLRVTATVMIKDETENNSNNLRHLNPRGIQFIHEECLSKSLVRACITLLPILGLTWLFGILAINNKTVVFEYLFCIFNSIQGLLIFFFYCIGSSEVRRECKRKLHNYETKRSLRSSSTGFKSPKQNNSLAGKASSRSAELISQKEYNEVTRL